MTPRRARWAAAVAVLVVAGAARADVEPLAPAFAQAMPGGLASAATCVRHAEFSEGAPRGGLLRLTGVPAGATVVHAVLYWSVLGGESPVPMGTPTLDGTPLSVVRLREVNASPCFRTEPWTAIFRADVTALVQGDGTYAIAGFPFSTAAPRAWTEGATLLVAWSAPGSPMTTVVIYEGVDVTHSLSEVVTQTLSGFTAPPAGPVSAKLVAAVGNGQPLTETLTFNGTDLELATGTGLLDGAICVRGYYDHTVVDVTGLVAPGSTSASFELRKIEDCHTLAAAALAVATDTSCSPIEPSAGDVRPGARPLLATRPVPSTVRLTWEDMGTTYQVWRGRIGNWYDHAPIGCNLRAPVFDALASSGNWYYLVAGCGPAASGGRDSFRRERPTALQASGSRCP